MIFKLKTCLILLSLICSTVVLAQTSYTPAYSTASTAAFTGTGTVTHYSTNTATTAATTASTVVCPGGWTIGIDSIDCYKFLYDKIGISWFAALQECESIGGFLAEPTSARENDMLASVATLIGVLVGVENWHIGLSDLVQENSWKWWRTQVAVTDTNWADGSPDITDPFNSLDCGIMFVSSASHNWKDVDCLDASINAAPICQYAGGELPSTASLATAASTASGTASTASGTASTASGTASTATASGTTASTAGSTASATAGSTASSAASEASTSSAAPVTCTTGWESFGGHCYMFVATTLNWQDAEDYCINLISGGHLVSINSLDEDLFVKELVQKYDGRSLTYWMGGAPAGATWTWTDGSAFNYDHTFNANPGAGECLFQRNSYYDNGWSSYACTAGTNLVCTI